MSTLTILKNQTTKKYNPKHFSPQKETLLTTNLTKQTYLYLLMEMPSDSRVIRDGFHGSDESESNLHTLAPELFLEILIQMDLNCIYIYIYIYICHQTKGV